LGQRAFRARSTLSFSCDVVFIVFNVADGKRPLVRSRCRWEDNIKVNHREVGWEGVDWIHLVGNRGKWRAVLMAVVKLLVAQHARNSFNCQRNC
jgi:hypothetical protein